MKTNSKKFGAFALLLLAALSVSFVACSGDEYYNEPNNDLTLAGRVTRAGGEIVHVDKVINGIIPDLQLCTDCAISSQVSWSSFDYDGTNAGAITVTGTTYPIALHTFTKARIFLPRDSRPYYECSTYVDSIDVLEIHVSSYNVRWHDISYPNSAHLKVTCDFSVKLSRYVDNELVVVSDGTYSVSSSKYCYQINSGTITDGQNR